MMSAIVKRLNNKIYVEISPDIKEPWWLDVIHPGKYIKNKDGSILIECRDCNVTISKPIIQQTRMGAVQTTQNITERWVYFDVPQLSFLVTEGVDLLNTHSLSDLQLELKEELTNNV